MEDVTCYTLLYNNEDIGHLKVNKEETYEFKFHQYLI